MATNLQKLVEGYRSFKEQYCQDTVQKLTIQKPEIMIVGCCDSRVDPALLFNTNLGDLFVVRNVANIVPPYEEDQGYHGTSAALEFGIRFLAIKHLIILGHSNCGGIQSLVVENSAPGNTFISRWVSVIRADDNSHSADDYAKKGLLASRKNCLTFPWIAQKVAQKELTIHLWFFSLQTGEIHAYSEEGKSFKPLK